MAFISLREPRNVYWHLSDIRVLPPISLDGCAGLTLLWIGEPLSLPAGKWAGGKLLDWSLLAVMYPSSHFNLKHVTFLFCCTSLSGGKWACSGWVGGNSIHPTDMGIKAIWEIWLILTKRQDFEVAFFKSGKNIIASSILLGLRRPSQSLFTGEIKKYCPYFPHETEKMEKLHLVIFYWPSFRCFAIFSVTQEVEL